VLISVSLGSPVPDAGGLLIPATAALVQLKETPGVTLVGVYENKVLLQMAAGVSVLLKIGEGLTVTVTFCVFEHPFAERVYMYVTTIGNPVVLTRVSFGLPMPVAAGLLIPATAALLQLNVVPAVALAGV